MKYHLIAGLTALIWGSTLVSSKLLLLKGMEPSEIMFCRFLLGYLLLWVFYPRTHRIESWRDELLFAGMGLFGGTIYFLAENRALCYTHATNVGLICATVPITTAIASHFILKEERKGKSFVYGSIIAFLGVILVVLNGNFVLRLNPLGDMLTFVAVFSWSAYCIMQKLLRGKYNALFVTRNIFFYGMLTMMVYFIYAPFSFPLSGFADPQVLGLICFLGFIASALCYWMWTIAIDHIGVVATNNYVYFLPVVTIITAKIFLGEVLTTFAIIGSILILCGLWLCNKNE